MADENIDRRDEISAVDGILESTKKAGPVLALPFMLSTRLELDDYLPLPLVTMFTESLPSIGVPSTVFPFRTPSVWPASNPVSWV